MSNMAMITAIKQQKNENRINVYLDGKFGFGIDLDNFVRLNLRVEQELSQEEINKIINTSEHQKILEKVLNFAMFRPRSKEEIKTWLRRKKIPEDMTPAIFETLYRLELIDDEKFARVWVEERLLYKLKSKKALKYELIMKGIDKEIIEKVLDEANINEESLVEKILEKNKRKWERLDDKLAKQKMEEYLARQGFSWSTIKSSVEKISKTG